MPVILGLTATGTLDCTVPGPWTLPVNLHLLDGDDRHRRSVPDQSVAQQNDDENADANPNGLLAAG